MQSESFEEIYTYVGPAPEPTPEEIKETEEMLERMGEDIARQIKRIRAGIRLDGTKYDEEELVAFKAIFGDK